MLKRILLPIFLFILIVFVVVETLKISVLIQNKVSKEMISTSVERNMFFNWTSHDWHLTSARVARFLSTI